MRLKKKCYSYSWYNIKEFLIKILIIIMNIKRIYFGGFYYIISFDNLNTIIFNSYSKIIFMIFFAFFLNYY